MATSSFYGSKIKEASNEKDVQRRKEVDDLISKYGRKSKPDPIRPNSYLLQRDYSSSSLKFGASRDSLYMPTSATSTAAGAIPAPAQHAITRRSSQYDMQVDNHHYEPPMHSTSNAGPRRYIASSKSSSNLYLNPGLGGHGGHGGGGLGMMDQGMGSLTRGPPLPIAASSRQQKTLSMHEAGGIGGHGGGTPRKNEVMETAASIIANAHQSGMGLGPADWWSTGTAPTANYGAAHPLPLQHDWSQKNVLNSYGGLPSSGHHAHGHGHAPAPPLPVSTLLL